MMRGYWFCRGDRLGYGDGREAEVGITHRVDCELFDWAQEHGYAEPHMGEHGDTYRQRLLIEARRRHDTWLKEQKAKPKPKRRGQQQELFG